MATYMGFKPAEKAPYYFVSYSTEDSARVAAYCRRMRQDNLPLWYDYGIEHGEEFDRVISEHIRYCEAVLLFMSKTPLGKEDTFVRKEFNIAKSRRKPIHVIYIDPISIDDVPVQYDLWWEELSRIQGVIAYEKDMEQTVAEIYRAICFTPGKTKFGEVDGGTGDDEEGVTRERRSKKSPADKRYAPLPAAGFRYYLGGEPYSDDIKLLGSPLNGCRVKKLKEALRNIFYHWNADQIFKNADGSELKEDFVKLIRVACRDSGLDGDRIEEILAHNVDVDPLRNKNCKFFRLFYEEIFKGKDRPKEFYWSNSLSQARLTPVFRDVGEFADKFCDQSSIGDNVRKIFSTHTKEICSFLEIDNPSRLLDSIMISTVERRGEVIWLDNSGEPPVNLGTVDSFIKRMKTFSDLKSMTSMVNFLRDFYFEPISEGSERYVLKTREGESYLREIYDDSIRDERELGELLGVSEASKSALSNYFTLLMEYVKITRATKLEISTRFGNMSFNSADLVSEVKRVVRECCEILYGEGVSDALKNSELPKRRCFVKLAKTFVTHKVLGVSRLGPSCEDYAALLDETTGSAEKYIEMFAAETPTILWRNQPTPIAEYISRSLADMSAGEMYAFLEATPIVTAYLERDGSRIAASDVEFEALLAESQKGFEDFEEYIGTMVRGEVATEEYVKIEDSYSEPTESAVKPVPVREVKEPTEVPIFAEEEKTVAAVPETPTATEVPAPAVETPKAPEPPKVETQRAPEPPKVETPPATTSSTRRARQPRKKSGDTSEGEQRLSDLLGL